ncbi:MAG TPA: hypothetical protein VHA12_02685 [Candidatus Nanoarchaeia archaeon]|nr:hypothetical protein [Candidatus Nanoarchaeia archaeon]
MNSKPVRVASFELGPETLVYQGKFIVAQGRDYLDVYGGPAAFHNHLSMLNGVKEEDVLGGGRYTLAYESLKLFDTSTGFGSIHEDIREQVAIGLVDHLSEKGFVITSTDVAELKIVKAGDKNASRWQSMGFSI